MERLSREQIEQECLEIQELGLKASMRKLISFSTHSVGDFESFSPLIGPREGFPPTLVNISLFLDHVVELEDDYHFRAVMVLNALKAYLQGILDIGVPVTVAASKTQPRRSAPMPW